MAAKWEACDSWPWHHMLIMAGLSAADVSYLRGDLRAACSDRVSTRSAVCETTPI